MLVTLVATELCPALFGPPAGAASNPIKPVLTGLLDRNSQPPSDYLDKMDGWVVRVNWSDLQTSQGAPIAANNAIDQAIAAVRALGAQYPMRLKIRVLAGTSAPLWAKSLDGPPVQLDSYPGDTVGRFWTTNFGNAYADLQSKLAAMYDSVPQVAETEVTRCTIWTGEPFLRDAGTPSTVRALLAAGYTAALDQTCQQAEIDAHKVWTTTPSGLAFNPYQHLNADASSTTDEAFTESMMTYCRSSLGQRCVLANNSIRSTQQGSNYQSMYAAMQRLQRPMAFQTAGPQQVGDWYQASLSAVQYGANSIELADNYSTQPYDPAQMAYIRQLLKGAAVSGSPSPVAPGGTLTVNWSGIASPSTTDWVGLFAASSAADTAYLTWKYTGTTAGNGTMALTVPTNASPASTYELRLFSNNGYTRLATSTPITVAAPSPPPSSAAVSGSPSPVAPGGTLTVNWSGIASPSTTDWVGLFAASSAADTAYLTWKYTGTTAGNGTMALTVPTNASPASTYELRLFSNNGYTRLATSTPITVAAASCSDPRVC